MTQQPDQEWEESLAWLQLAIMALPAAPLLFAAFSTSAERWMLGHGMLVDSRHALFTLPGMSSGPDLRRLMALVLLAIALGLVTHLLTRPAKRRR